MNWNKYPFFRLVFALVAGIAIHDAVGSLGMPQVQLFALLMLFLGMMMLFSRWLKSYRYRWVFGVLTIIVFIYLGYFRACLQEIPSKKDYYGNLSLGEGYYLARVDEPPTEKDNTVKVLLKLEGFKTDTAEIKLSGKVMAYFQKSEKTLDLHYGNLLAFPTPVDPVPPPLNPEEFDYKKYLERRGVTGRLYLKDGDWHDTGVREGNPVFVFAYRFRDRLLNILRQSGFSDDEFGIAAAVLLGYDESLPAQVRHNFVAAGSMHILCVSGMHVGIVYLLASFFLNLLGKRKKAAAVKKFVLLFLIWLYALLTGLSPSVMRSALMISFLIVGELIHRKGFALNSIAASAFVLLLINPNNIYAIGFQLSYVAVVGIVLLQRPIYNLLYVKNKLLDKLWEITAVSLAAQISTMPFTIFYFNQFTPYFWLSNLFMTPLSFLLILGGMLLLLFSSVPLLGYCLGKLVWICLYLMNGLVAGIEQMPLSMVKGLYMNDLQFGMSLVLLLLFWLFVILKKKRMLMEMLVLSVLFALTLAIDTRRILQQNSLMFYSLNKHAAIDLVSGSSHILLCDEQLLNNPSSIDYSLKGNWAKCQLTMNPPCYTLGEDFALESAIKRNQLVSFHGVLLAFWDPSMAVDSSFRRITVNYLMVREKHTPNLQRINNSYQIGMLLIDGSVPKYLAAEWIQQAETLGIPYHDLKEGYYECKL